MTPAEKKYRQEYQRRNREKCRAAVRKHYWAHRDEELARRKKYNDEHTEQKSIYDRQHYQEHQERLCEQTKSYARTNKEAYAAYTARRAAAKAQRTPGWLTGEQEQQIKDFYMNCPKDMAVDHIIPLRGKYISGMHHPDNLQYLTKSENSAKGNRHPVEGR